MKEPIAFVYGNCVFGAGPTDAWAAFAVALAYTYAQAIRAELMSRP